MPKITTKGMAEILAERLVATKAERERCAFIEKSIIGMLAEMGIRAEETSCGYSFTEEA